MGYVFKYGDNIDTDVIIPARYLNTADPAELKVHCMEDLDPEFAKNVVRGDLIVAGKNFGCGSSREHAPLAIKTSGIGCIIAESFARIFYRNSFNIGLAILECKEAVEKIDHHDKVEVDFYTGEIKNLTKKESYQAEPFPEFITKLIMDEGLVNYVAGHLSMEYQPEEGEFSWMDDF